MSALLVSIVLAQLCQAIPSIPQPLLPGVGSSAGLSTAAIEANAE